MKHIITLLIPILFNFNARSQTGFFTNYQDTNRIGFSFNTGVSYKDKLNGQYNTPYAHGAHWNIRFRHKFYKSTQLVNGSIGLQFSSNNYKISEKIVFNKDSAALQYAPNPYQGAVWVRARSLSVPLLVSLRPRNIPFLNRFKLETGFMFGTNFSRIKQFLYDAQADTDKVLPPKAALKEIFKVNLPRTKISFLSALYFDNYSIFYEYCFPTNNGTHFNVGRTTIGVGVFF